MGVSTAAAHDRPCLCTHVKGALSASAGGTCSARSTSSWLRRTRPFKGPFRVHPLSGCLSPHCRSSQVTQRPARSCSSQIAVLRIGSHAVRTSEGAETAAGCLLRPFCDFYNAGSIKGTQAVQPHCQRCTALKSIQQADIMQLIRHLAQQACHRQAAGPM